MTKRRWLKSAIEESTRQQMVLPWARRRSRSDQSVADTAGSTDGMGTRA